MFEYFDIDLMKASFEWDEEKELWHGKAMQYNPNKGKKEKQKWEDTKQKQKRKMYRHTYYEKNRYAICKKTIGIYWENAVRRAKMRNKEIVVLMYRLYAYE